MLDALGFKGGAHIPILYSHRFSDGGDVEGARKEGAGVDCRWIGVLT
jgi:hypothetical protein